MLSHESIYILSIDKLKRVYLFDTHHVFTPAP